MTVTTQSSPIMIHSEREEQEWLKEYTRNCLIGKGVYDMERRERRVRKSKKMQMIEAQYNEKLETLLPRMYNLYDGLPGMVKHMNLNKSTIHYWMRTLGVIIESRAYALGEETIEDRVASYEESLQDLEKLKKENAELKQNLEIAKRSSGPVY